MHLEQNSFLSQRTSLLLRLWEGPLLSKCVIMVFSRAACLTEWPRDPLHLLTAPWWAWGDGARHSCGVYHQQQPAVQTTVSTWHRCYGAIVSNVSPPSSQLRNTENGSQHEARISDSPESHRLDHHKRQHIQNTKPIPENVWTVWNCGTKTCWFNLAKAVYCLCWLNPISIGVFLPLSQIF